MKFVLFTFFDRDGRLMSALARVDRGNFRIAKEIVWGRDWTAHQMINELKALKARYGFSEFTVYG